MVQNYNMERETTIDLMTSSSSFQINVKSPSGKIPVDLRLECSIVFVKEQILEIDAFLLMFLYLYIFFM
jgi:hypothetical protein